MPMRIDAGSRRLCVRAVLAAVVCAAVLAGAGGSRAQDGERDAALERMRQRAAGTRVFESEEPAAAPCELLGRSLLRYTDEPRRIRDASLWLWRREGRPVAIEKIEDYHGEQSGPRWVHCLASLSSSRIAVRWSSGRTWTAGASGGEWHPILDAPAPAATAPLRLAQMKRLARRFSATMIDPRDNSRQEMRLLATPLYRYEAGAPATADGAIFGYASNGTNPDVLVRLELRDGDTPQWEYAVAGMTAHGATVRLDGATVWEKPFTGDPDDFENWLFFAEPLQE